MTEICLSLKSDAAGPVHADRVTFNCSDRDLAANSPTASTAFSMRSGTRFNFQLLLLRKYFCMYRRTTIYIYVSLRLEFVPLPSKADKLNFYSECLKFI